MQLLVLKFHSIGTNVNKQPIDLFHHEKLNVRIKIKKWLPIMERKPDDERILSSLKALREKTTGIQRDAIDYQIMQVEDRLKEDNEKDFFTVKTTKKRIEAKIFREQNFLKGIVRMLEIDKTREEFLNNKKDFLMKKLYFLEKEKRDSFDSDEEVNYVKTTGNVKFLITNISINPIFKCKNLVFVVDGEVKSDIAPTFTGEFNIPMANSKEFEIIAFGENNIIISLLFFPCEYFICHVDPKSRIIDLKDGFIEATITFEKESKLIRRNAELVCIIEAGHSLETYKSLSPFKCCVCYQFIALFSSAYRCYKCKFTCHKQCSKFIFFKCPCTSQQDDKLTKRYNIPHILQPSSSMGVDWCAHCGSRIAAGDTCSECVTCGIRLHAPCVIRVFNSCGITFDMRCIISEFNPPVPEFVENKPSLSIDHFTLIKVLGRGSFGKVMLAKHKKDDIIIALKILKKESLVDANETAYIELERKVLSFATMSEHPFLMRMLYCFQDRRQIFFGTEFISGGDLFHHAAKNDFSHKQIRLYAAEICLGLEFLHKNNIIYRDMKLDNILIYGDGHIKIADFGLCKDNFGPFAVTFTYCGTPDTIAPEVILQGGYTKDADWWSYGIVLYEMFEGEPPFNGATPSEMAIGILNDQFTFTKTPEVARDLITKLLTKDPKKRLGYGLKDGEEIREHPYFIKINWDDVYYKKYRPPFIPDTSLDENFDQEFIDEPIHLTPCSSVREFDKFFTNFK